VGYKNPQLTEQKALKLCPYKIRVIQQLFTLASEARWFYSSQFEKVVANGFFDLEQVFFSAGACFTLNENVNSRNNRYWCLENPHRVHNFLEITLK
jgi:hypothetical protein